MDYTDLIERIARDIEGLHIARGAEATESRLIVLDISFPARLWVLDAATLGTGKLDVGRYAILSRPAESERLGPLLEAIIRHADAELIAPELEAKSVVLEASESLS